MALQFVLGNSGSGKTEYMYREIVRQAGENPNKNYLVIVPEQFTMQTQKKLVELAPNHAIMNIDVLSFQRLAYRVFDELGMNKLCVLEETGKNLVLRKVAKQKEHELSVLRSNMNRMGYVDEVKSLISELVQYNISPERLEAYIEQGNVSTVLSMKLRDIITLYRGFLEYMSDSYITAEEVLNILKSVASKSQIICGSILVFDEFTGFTPIQKTLLKELFPITESTWISLTIDAKENFFHCKGEEELFAMTKKTIRTLMQMAEELHIEVKEPVVLCDSEKKRFLGAPSLAFMEKNLFRSYYKKQKEQTDEISITALTSLKDEVVMVAREINCLVREHGYRFREIAVVTGAVETYGNYVDAIFTKYQIPYFLDTTREILFHPFIEWIRALLEIVQTDFSYEAVFRFLRCGFIKLEDDAIDLLDNYVVATGIHGRKAWKERFLRMPRQEKLYDLEQLEKLRQEVMAFMNPIVDVFDKKDATVSDGIMAIYQLLTDLEIEKQLWEKEAFYLSLDMQAKSKEYGQIYRIVIELFEKYYALFGTQPLQIDDFIDVLDAGFSAAKVAVIPPGFDSVTIGDIERTRLNHIKVLFFIGVNDGIIPKMAQSGGIISEYERQMMQEADLELAPGARELAFIQRFYLYRNLTKPSERLYLSFSKVDGEGKAIRPSYLVRTIQNIFPNCNYREIDDIEKQVDFSTPQAAMDYLINGKRDETWFALAKYFLADEKQKEQVEKILKAPFYCYEMQPISKAVARALYGRNMEGSVTRLERFAACAYAHYLQYGLMLKEREQCSFENLDIGNLYHTALERYASKLAESKYDWFCVPDETREHLAALSMQEAVAEYPNMSIYATAQNQYMAKRMENIFVQTVWALTKQVQKGRFVPQQFEISFSEYDNIQALSFDLENDIRINLTGRIDRLDVCEDDHRIYIKVIDYKSGNTKFDLIRLYHGLQLQLVVYMNAAMELTKKEHAAKEIVPGGMLYYHIDDPVLEKKEENALLLALRPDGLINREEEIYRAFDENVEGKSDVIPLELKKSGEISESRSKVASTEEFHVISQYVNEQIKTRAQQIYDGDIRIHPYRDGNETGCDYCPYHAVCGMDTKIRGYSYRHLKTLSKEELFKNMSEGECNLWQ